MNMDLKASQILKLKDENWHYKLGGKGGNV
jgi:hypothetical protein